VERFYDEKMINGVLASADGPIKTFPLRGIKDSPPYLHDDRLLTLEDSVEFFNLVLGVKLTAAEKQDLVAFLRTLGRLTRGGSRPRVHTPRVTRATACARSRDRGGSSARADSPRIGAGRSRVVRTHAGPVRELGYVVRTRGMVTARSSCSNSPSAHAPIREAR